jgi:hypothetical protein
MAGKKNRWYKKPMISSDRRELPVYRMPHPYGTPSKLETPLYWRIRESERHEELCKEIQLCSCDLKAVFSSPPSVMLSQADEHVPHGPSATVFKRNALYGRVSGVTKWWLAWYLFFCQPWGIQLPHSPQSERTTPKLSQQLPPQIDLKIIRRTHHREK